MILKNTIRIAAIQVHESMGINIEFPLCNSAEPYKISMINAHTKSSSMSYFQ